MRLLPLARGVAVGLIVAAAACAAPPLALAQEAGGAPADDGAPAPADTGDAWIDARLADIDRYAARHPDAFVDELARYQGAPRALAEEALAAGTPAGHLYYACALAQALGRPCRQVLDAWRSEAATGWAVVAARLAPDANAAARERVKRGIVHSYDRWARPVALDAALRRALPDRAVRN
jgi:hypothetical protein